MCLSTLALGHTAVKPELKLQGTEHQVSYTWFSSCNKIIKYGILKWILNDCTVHPKNCLRNRTFLCHLPPDKT